MQDSRPEFGDQYLIQSLRQIIVDQQKMIATFAGRVNELVYHLDRANEQIAELQQKIENNEKWMRHPQFRLAIEDHITNDGVDWEDYDDPQ